MELVIFCKIYNQTFFSSFFSEIIFCLFLGHPFIFSMYAWDFRFKLLIIWPCVGVLLGIWYFSLCEASPIFIRFMISRIDKSSTNLYQSFLRTQSALLFVWESNFQLLMPEPSAPESGIFWNFDSFWCPFTRISPDWKNEIIWWDNLTWPN